MDAIKEFELKCVCGSIYKVQGTKEQLDEYLNSQTWTCDLGWIVELVKKSDYLTMIGESDKLSPKPKIEPKKKDELEAYELPKGLEHIGFGIFRDSENNIWDYRAGPNGERFYSKK
jgi:hypothetical protein